MKEKIKIVRYKKDLSYSYALGATLAFEILKNKSEYVEKIYLHPNVSQSIVDELKKISGNIEFEINNKVFNILSDKENCFVIVLFRKFESKLGNDNIHLVLVNPSNAGNFGTIIRSALGFNVKNIAVIAPAVDKFDPKVIRASMGAIFKINIVYYQSFEDYCNEYYDYKCYPFMLQAKYTLQNMNIDKNQKKALVFGNEATGLPDYFLNYGQPVIIKHSKEIDSLNIQTAVSIGLYEFTK